MNRAARRRLLGLNVVTRVVECSGCGETALHVETWEGDDEPHGLPIELGRCDCGGFWLSRDPSEGGDAGS